MLKNNTKKHPKKVKVHYDTFAKKYDEWIEWSATERFGELCYSSSDSDGSDGEESD